MANTISQLEINGTTYDILDANTKTKLDQLESTVTSLQSSVDWRGVYDIAVQFSTVSINGNYHALFRLNSRIPAAMNIVIQNVYAQIGTASTTLDINDFTVREWWGSIDIYTQNEAVLTYPFVGFRVSLG